MNFQIILNDNAQTSKGGYASGSSEYVPTVRRFHHVKCRFYEVTRIISGIQLLRFLYQRHNQPLVNTFILHFSFYIRLARSRGFI